MKPFTISEYLDKKKLEAQDPDFNKKRLEGLNESIMGETYGKPPNDKSIAPSESITLSEFAPKYFTPANMDSSWNYLD